MIPQALQARRYLFMGTAALILVLLYTIRLSIQAQGLSIQIIRAEKPASQPNQPLEPAETKPKTLTIGKKVAAVIENRPLAGAVPLFLHFASVLGPEWPIILFTTQKEIPDSAPFRRLVDNLQFEIRSLPSDTDFKSRDDVSGFLTQPWIYDQLAPAEHILLFQTDSILCAQSSFKVEDFLEYDFVGAPIDAQYGQGYNGGLSLRNRTMVLDIIQKSNWASELEHDKTQAPTVKFEDQWFYTKMKEYPDARLPSVDVARKFAVETIWYDKPLGYHQISRWHADRISDVDNWCPEHRMAATELISH